ncbi:MAG: hypothetical protein AAGC71_01770 [Pseudomonadota bacterium]
MGTRKKQQTLSLRKTDWLGLIGTTLTLLVSQVVHADHRPDDAVTAAIVQQVSDSHRLYQRALARRDAAMLAIAAELRAEALGTWQPKGDVDGGLPTPRDMIEQAATWAAGDEALSTLVNRFAERRFRGNTNGPLVRHTMISAARPLTIEAAFTPEFPAVIYLEGAPNGHFDLRVFDADGSTVCMDNSDKAYKLCRFLSSRADPYTVTATSDNDDAVELLVITN